MEAGHHRLYKKNCFLTLPKGRKAVNRLAHETAISTGYETAVRLFFGS